MNSLAARHVVLPCSRKAAIIKLPGLRAGRVNRITAAQAAGPTRAFSESTDPHEAAAARVANNSSSERLQAAEALGRVDRGVRLQNVALATALAGFVTGVWWYSATAVGGGSEIEGEGNAGLQELEEAADEARQIRVEKENEEDRIKNLLEGGDEEEEYDDLDKPTSRRRPLWKRVVFFWKKE
jgi:hypothetical protein